MKSISIRKTKSVLIWKTMLVLIRKMKLVLIKSWNCSWKTIDKLIAPQANLFANIEISFSVNLKIKGVIWLDTILDLQSSLAQGKKV